MNKSLKIAFAALLLGSASLAAAQTASPAGSLADRESWFQSASGTGAFYHPAPVASRIADDPTKGLTERQYQSLSNEDPEFQPHRFSAEKDNAPSFAKANPHGGSA